MTFIPTITNIVDNNNSTSTPLTGSQTFTGVSTNVLKYSSIIINSVSNVSSAISGLSIQFSSDNTNWDLSTSYTIANENVFSLNVTILAQYFRIIYVNGTIPQNSFRLQTILQPIQTSVLPNKIDNNNSTTIPLTASSVFTGQPTNVTSYNSLFLSCISNVDSITNGLSVQFSQDGTNWDSVTTYTTIANIDTTLSFAISSSFFRVVYTNDVIDQTIFRLQVKLQTTFGQTTLPADTTLTVNTNATVTTALLQSIQDNQKYAPIKSTSNNALYVSIRIL